MSAMLCVHFTPVVVSCQSVNSGKSFKRHPWLGVKNFRKYQIRWMLCRITLWPLTTSSWCVLWMPLPPPQKTHHVFWDNSLKIPPRSHQISVPVWVAVVVVLWRVVLRLSTEFPGEAVWTPSKPTELEGTKVEPSRLARQSLENHWFNLIPSFYQRGNWGPKKEKGMTHLRSNCLSARAGIVLYSIFWGEQSLRIFLKTCSNPSWTELCPELDVLQCATLSNVILFNDIWWISSLF